MQIQFKQAGERLRRRAVPFAALALATGLTFPVIAAGEETYTLSDGETTESITVYQGDAEAALARSAAFSGDTYFISAVQSDGAGYAVTVKKKHTILIQADGETVSCVTGDSLVSNILKEAGVEYDDDDIVTPSLDTKLTEPVTITIQRVERVRKTETEEIAYETTTRTTSELRTGESRVVQEGVNGTKELIYEYVYEDGTEISKTQVGEIVLRAAVEEIIETGTASASTSTAASSEAQTTTDSTTQTAAAAGTSSGSVSALSGETLTYTKVLTCEATAYCDDGYTASGTVARVGEVAVDPSVIPLGTKLYITSEDGTSWVYGTATAEDTGGAIKGNRIDLYFDTEEECEAFGRQQALVYILE